jgi:hypothetical protein
MSSAETFDDPDEGGDEDLEAMLIAIGEEDPLPRPPDE